MKYKSINEGIKEMPIVKCPYCEINLEQKKPIRTPLLTDNDDSVEAVVCQNCGKVLGVLPHEM